MYVRQDNGSWHEAADGDDNVAAIMQSMPYLLGVNDADDVLENKLRKHFVDLIDETTEGVAPDAHERYEMAIDTRNYSSDYPLQWQNFEDAVIPGAVQVTPCRSRCGSTTPRRRRPPSTSETHWAWERLAYSNERFTPIDPGSVAVPAASSSATSSVSTLTPTTAPAG